MQGITWIVVITDAIPATKWIFDTFIHPYQLHSIIISDNLRNFFNKNSNNTVSFWNCSSNNKWSLHLLVDKELKLHRMNPILPSKTLWEFSKKEECNSIIRKWQIYFQASDYKGRNFLELNDDDSQPIYSIYIQKVELSSNTWAHPTCCIHTWLDW